MNTGALLRYLLARLSEPSTWRGITVALGGTAYYVAPDRLDAIMLVVSIVLGGIEAARSESKPAATKSDTPAS
jgi:hypothetical protein